MTKRRARPTQEEEGGSDTDTFEEAAKSKTPGKRGRKPLDRWTPGERRNLQDAVFSVCAPRWERIRERAKLKVKPLREIQENTLFFLDQVALQAKGKESQELFARILNVFLAGKTDFDNRVRMRPTQSAAAQHLQGLAARVRGQHRRSQPRWSPARTRTRRLSPTSKR